MAKRQKIEYADYTKSVTGGKNDRYGKIYESMLKSEAYKSLSNAEKVVLFTCILHAHTSEAKQCLWRHGEACKRVYSEYEFVFPDAHFELYGLNARNARRSMKVLIEKGFIKVKENNKVRKQVNVYSFVSEWYRQKKTLQ